MLNIQFELNNMNIDTMKYQAETYNVLLYTHEGVQQRFLDAQTKQERIGLLKAELENIPLIDSIEREIAEAEGIMYGSDNEMSEDDIIVLRAEKYHLITEIDGDYISYHDPSFSG